MFQKVKVFKSTKANIEHELNHFIKKKRAIISNIILLDVSKGDNGVEECTIMFTYVKDKVHMS